MLNEILHQMINEAVKKHPDNLEAMLNSLIDNSLEETADLTLTHILFELATAEPPKIKAAKILIDKMDFDSFTDSQSFEILHAITNQRAPLEIIYKALKCGLRASRRDVDNKTALDLFSEQSGHSRNLELTKYDDDLIKLLTNYPPRTTESETRPSATVENSSILRFITSCFRSQ